jgi:hypothetical protein
MERWAAEHGLLLGCDAGSKEARYSYGTFLTDEEL